MKKSMKIKSVSYDEGLMERLKDRDYATEYLQACFEETDMPAVFLSALNNVARAYGIAKLAKKTKLNRTTLYRILSESGNPGIRTLEMLLDAMGFKLSIEPKQLKKAA